jgi:hypothetical protein
MKEFEPSNEFVSKVMKSVYACEDVQEVELKFAEKLLASRLFRYALSGGGIFFGVFFSPLACI